MKLALFDDNRLGVVTTAPDGDTIVDVTAALPVPHDPDPVTAGWWRGLCRDFASVSGALRAAAADGEARPVAEVTLRAPVLGPPKVVAAAMQLRRARHRDARRAGAHARLASRPG